MPAALTMEQLLREGSAGQLTKLAEAATNSAHARAAILPELSITHGRLFTNPGKIICIGLNYKRHAAEVKIKEPSQPVLFNKYNNALAGAN